MNSRYSYIAVFSYDEDGISIVFPDLPGCLPCADKEDTEMALANAREALSVHLHGMKQDGDYIPEPTSLQNIKVEEGEVPVLIEVYI